MAEYIFCTNCGTQLDPKARFCTECGSPVLSKPPYVAESEPVTPIATEPTPPTRVVTRPPSVSVTGEKFCMQCGAKILAMAEICPQCGVRQIRPLRDYPGMIQVRDWILVVVLTIITVGIYGIYWVVSTKNEMVDMGADIPTAWLLIIPIANIYFMWKYAHGVEFISEGAISGVLLFILWLVFFPAAIYMTQTELNRQAITV